MHRLPAGKDRDGRLSQLSILFPYLIRSSSSLSPSFSLWLPLSRTHTCIFPPRPPLGSAPLTISLTRNCLFPDFPFLRLSPRRKRILGFSLFTSLRTCLLPVCHLYFSKWPGFQDPLRHRQKHTLARKVFSNNRTSAAFVQHALCHRQPFSTEKGNKESKVQNVADLKLGS